MPEMDGIEFLKHFRKEHPSLPFIIFTGRGREEIAIAAFESGADSYIQKGGDPVVQFAELSHKIRKSVERRKSAQALRESEEKFRDLYDNAPNGYYSIGTDGRITQCNYQASVILGSHCEDLVGKKIFSFYANTESGKEKARWLFAAFMSGKEIVNEELQMQQADGNLIWISLTVNAMRDASGMITGSRTIITDISQRKAMEDELKKKNEELGAAFEELTVIEEELRQNYGELGKSEQALRTSEERYRNVVEDQTEFISRFLPDGTHIFVNEAYCRYFGLKRDEILGHRFRPKIPADDHERVRRFFESLTQDNSVDSIEHRIIMPDGSIRWQWWSDRAIFDPSGTVTEYQSVGRDITARYLSEEYLARISALKQELLGAAPLEEKLKRITDFLVELFGVDFARIWISGRGDLCDNGCIHAPVTDGPHVCRNRASCLHLVVSSGRYTHTDGGHRRVPFGAYKIGRIASGEETWFVTNDVTHDPRVHDHEWAASLGLVSFAGFRLVSAERKTHRCTRVLQQAADITRNHRISPGSCHNRIAGCPYRYGGAGIAGERGEVPLSC